MHIKTKAFNRLTVPLSHQKSIQNRSIFYNCFIIKCDHNLDRIRKKVTVPWVEGGRSTKSFPRSRGIDRENDRKNTKTHTLYWMWLNVQLIQLVSWSRGFRLNSILLKRSQPETHNHCDWIFKCMQQLCNDISLVVQVLATRIRTHDIWCF